MLGDARRRITAASSRGGRRTRLALALAGLLAATLLGAFQFGLWHVLFGGLVKGNWRAGGFGIALAVIAGVLLTIEVAIARRLLPRDRPAEGR
jgi:Na+(H+)/acetate symporter ActP